MTNYKADNSIESPKQAFYFRGLYRNEGVRDTPANPEIRDLSFAESVLYGRVNTVLNTVYPNENFLQVMISEERTEESFRLIDFVADAFTSVKTAMQRAKAANIISNSEPIFSNFTARRTYESPIPMYNQYALDLMTRFIEEHLVAQGNKKNVFTFTQFVKHFLDFLAIENKKQHTPFTFTSWQRSTTSNIFTSGLAIDIAGLEFGSDPEIEQNILNNSCFPYYLKVCRANGFLVSRMAPTLMVADVLSPGLLRFSRKKFVTSLEGVFSLRYELAYKIDYNLMINRLMDGFNLFVGTHSFEKVITQVCSTKSTARLQQRKTITPNQAFSKSIKSYLLTYAKIRHMEEKEILGEQQMDLLLKRIKTSKIVDSSSFMGYINDAFRLTYKAKHGGFNFYRNKFDVSDENKIPIVVSSPPEDITNISNETQNLGNSASGVTTTSPSTGGSSGGY